MTTSTDRLITSDLGALGAHARRELPPASEALRDTGIYRDGHAGAQARRDALAEERRVQLALMPLAIAQVFAHRVGRAATGAVALLCSAAMLMLLADPLLMRVVTWLVPGLGLNLGTCLVAAATVLLVTYVVATWIAEAWFTRKMRHAIETHADVYSDLDHLARGPVEMAQQLVRRIDGWSTGLWLAGVTSLATVMGYLVVVAGAFSSLERVLSSTSLFAERAAMENLGPVIYTLVLAGALAVYVGRSCARESRMAEPSPWMQRLSHWGMIVAGMAVGLVTMFEASRMMMRLYRGVLPSNELRYVLAIGGELAVLSLVTWTVLWWRRRERSRLGD